jgi:alpha-L-fucosidase
MKILQRLRAIPICLVPFVFQATAQVVVQPAVFSVSSENPYGIDRGAARIRDGAGLSSGGSGIAGGADAIHGSNPNGTMWTTRGNTGLPADTAPSITFDLGAVTDLQAIRIWSYNENSFTRFGARAVRVSTSPDSTTFTVMGDIEVAQGGGNGSELAQDFAAVVPATRFVKLQILSNWDGASFWSSITGSLNGGVDGRYLAGLSEVRFVGAPGAPPPATVSNPYPGSGATGVEPDASLSWDSNDAGGAVTGYQVFVGVGDVAYDYLVHTESLPASALPRISWQPPANVIQKGSNFWWRVEKTTAGGTVSSPVWTFATRPETTAEKDARMAWFRHDKLFGAIVWGLYSGAEGVWPPKTGSKQPSWSYAEWMQFWSNTSTGNYQNSLEPHLTGSDFDATRMARMCKDAGMTMVYVMPRHHDGYAIWNTQTTTLLAPNGFKIANSPYNLSQRDYLKELVDALRAEGLRVGFYFSLGDWHHPDFPHSGGPWAHPRAGEANPPGHSEVWANYVSYLHQQVKEIVAPGNETGTNTSYGPFDVVYFDYSSGGINGEQWGATKLVHMVRRYNPDIIINNRLWNGLDNPNGDYATPEANIDNVGYNEYDRDWEAIMSANEPPTWGYGRPDLYPFKSAKDLAWDIVDVVSKNGTIELSVSPKGDGSLHPDQLSRYAELGAWMAVNGASIKGTTGNPVGSRPPWGEYTSKRNENRLYLHVFNRPADGNVVATGLYGPVGTAWLLNDPARTPLAVTPAADGFQVFLPAASADPINTVIVVDYVFPEIPATTTTVAAVSSENVIGLDRDASNSVDSSGLEVGSTSPVHATGEDGMVWTTVGSLGPGTDYDPYVIYDLGSVTDVASIREWGYNSNFQVGSPAVNLAVIGPDEVDVHTSVYGVVYTFAGTVHFALAPGVAGYAGHAIPVDYRGIRFIKLDIKTNHDGAVFNGTGSMRGLADGRSLTGLSEIRFEGPATAAPAIRISAIRYAGSVVEVDASSLEPGTSYRLRRSTNLQDGFPVVVDGPRLPTGAAMTFTDSSPPATRAFYRVEEAP